MFAIDIEYCDHFTIGTMDRKYDLGAGTWIACDMSRKRFNVRNDQDLVALPGTPTHSFAHLDPRASGRALKWTKNEFPIHDAVPAGPKIVPPVMKFGYEVGHLCGGIALIPDQSLDPSEELIGP